MPVCKRPVGVLTLLVSRAPAAGGPMQCSGAGWMSRIAPLLQLCRAGAGVEQRLGTLKFNISFGWPPPCGSAVGLCCWSCVQTAPKAAVCISSGRIWLPVSAAVGLPGERMVSHASGVWLVTGSSPSVCH